MRLSTKRHRNILVFSLSFNLCVSGAHTTSPTLYSLHFVYNFCSYTQDVDLSGGVVDIEIQRENVGVSMGLEVCSFAFNKFFFVSDDFDFEFDKSIDIRVCVGF